MNRFSRQQREERRQTKFQTLFETRKREVLGVPASPLRDLPELLRDLQAIPHRDWGLYAFAREPLRGRFTLPRQLDLIDGAMACGQEHARRLRRDFPDATPQEMAEGLGLRLSFPPRPQDGGGRVLFARFTVPDGIEVFADATRRAGEALEGDEALRQVLGDADVRQVLLAHELFHWVEEQHRDTIFTETTRVDLRLLGLFPHRSRILCLGEVAAMAFAKELTGLPYSPYLYDVFLLYLYSPQAACNLAAQIKTVLAQGEQSA